MNTHTSAAKSRVNGYTWGYNNAGGLGVGSTARAIRPVPVCLPEGAVEVQGGSDFTVARTESGEVWTWGGNRYGQLGNGTQALSLTPQRIDLPRSARATAIAVGQDHVLVLTRRGAYAWGRNHHGQLGDGTATDRAHPVRLDLSDAAQVAAGNAVSMVVTNGGEVLTWGRGSAQKSDADLVAPKALSLPAKTNALMVDAGQRHVVVLTAKGHLLTFGVDPAGRPLPASMPTDPRWGRVISISAGDDHTVGLTEHGVVIAWGANYHGQLGARDLTNRDTPVSVRIPDLKGRVVEVVAGGNSTMARSSEHQVFAWGQGRFGQIGDGKVVNQTRPHRVEIPHDGAVTAIHTGRFHNLARISSHH
jgi:alpha-tubulin suppressor-like RCC1 family protein